MKYFIVTAEGYDRYNGLHEAENSEELLKSLKGSDEDRHWGPLKAEEISKAKFDYICRNIEDLTEKAKGVIRLDKDFQPVDDYSKNVMEHRIGECFIDATMEYYGGNPPDTKPDEETMGKLYKLANKLFMERLGELATEGFVIEIEKD